MHALYDCQYHLCRVLPKRATALQFSSDDQYILVSDKAGDLHRYTLSDPTSSGEHLLGHFSMLLDMVCLYMYQWTHLKSEIVGGCKRSRDSGYLKQAIVVKLAV